MKNKILLGIMTMFLITITSYMTIAVVNDAGGYWAGDLNGSFPDSSGNGNTGSIMGATFTNFGKLSGAYNYSGVSKNNITIASSTSINTSDNFAYNFWVYSDGSDMGFLQKGRFSVDNFQIGYLSDKIYFYMIAGGVACDGGPAFSGTNITHNAWTMVTVQRRTSVIEVWINGVNTSTLTGCTANPLSSNQPLVLGYGTSGLNYFTGATILHNIHDINSPTQNIAIAISSP